MLVQRSSKSDCKCTGKERDSESGLDYFGARFYSSTMGRFQSPDSSDDPEAVPFAHLTNPQSLNLYGYVQNNPMSNTDPDGHEQCKDGTVADACVTTAPPDPVGLQLGVNLLNIANHTLQVISNVTQHISNFLNMPRDPGCMASATASGAAMGAGAGGVIGGLAGGGGGTLVAPGVGTIGGGAAGAMQGVGYGGMAGSSLGTAYGMMTCSTSGGSGGGGGRGALQKGGNSISKATANALNKATGKNLSPREWGRAVEELKQSEGLPPNSHGTIMSNGDYISANGANLGNLTHYLP